MKAVRLSNRGGVSPRRLLTFCGAVLAAAVALAAAPASAALPSPNGATYAKGAMFTVGEYSGSDPLPDFPVLVRVSENSPSGFSYSDVMSQPDGADIAFIDTLGNALPFEIDTWNTSGESLFWVRLPSMENGTQFVMCWGGAMSGKTLCADNPFDGYKGVWHMNAVSPADVSGSGNDGTAAGNVALAAGTVGSGLSYPTADDYVTCGSNLAESELDGGFTVEGWVNLANLSGNHALFGKSGFISYRTSGTGVQITTPAVSDYGVVNNFITTANEWHHFALSFKPNTSLGARHYVDGVLKTEQNTGGTKNGTGSIEMWIARNQWGSGQGFVGLVDEYRLYPGIRSADWIAATYATQSSATFLSKGMAEAYEASPEPTLGVSATGVSYTNATFSATVGTLGMDAAMANGASWVDATLLVSASADDFSAPVFAVALDRFTAAPATVSVPLHPFATNATYYAKVVGTNSFDVAGESGVASFTTPAPGAPAGIVSFAQRGFTTLSGTGSVSDFGTGAESATVSLEASTASDFATVAASSSASAAALDTTVQLAVSGLAPATAYHLRLKIENDWGIVAYVPLSNSYTTRDVPFAVTGLGYEFSPDGSTVDFSFAVSDVFDGATGTATLEYDGRTVGAKPVSAAGTLLWTGVAAATGAAQATVTVSATVGGTAYEAAWTVTVAPGSKASVVSSLSGMRANVLHVGDSLTLPELTGPDDYYVLTDCRAFALDGRVLTALEPGFGGVVAMEWDAETGTFVRNAEMGFGVVVPEPAGSGRVWLYTHSASNQSFNWTTVAWENLTDGSSGFPNRTDDVAMIALPGNSTFYVDASVTVGALYFGFDSELALPGVRTDNQGQINQGIRIAGANSSTLTFAASGKNRALLRMCNFGNRNLYDNNPHVYVGYWDATAARQLSIVQTGGMDWDGGAVLDCTDTATRDVFGRVRMGTERGASWNVPEGKTLHIYNITGYKNWGDDQCANAQFWMNSYFPFKGAGEIVYDGPGSTCINNPFRQFEGTLVVRNKQRYSQFSFGSRGGSFYMLNSQAPVDQYATNTTLKIEGDVGYNSGLALDRSYGVVATGSAHGDGSNGWMGNVVPAKKWILNGGAYADANMNNDSASWRADGTTATETIREPNGAESLCVSNGFSYISLGQNGNTDRPTNNLEFARLEHAGDGVLVASTDRMWNSYQGNEANRAWRVRLALGGFHDHAIGGTGRADAIHGPAGVRTNILESTAPIVPWIVAPVESYSALYFPGASPEGELVLAGHPKSTVLDEASEPTANVNVDGKTIALSADRTVNSLRLVNNRVAGRNLGAGRTLAITSGGLIMGNGNWNNTAFIGDESGFNAGTAGTLVFPNKAYIYSAVVNASKNYHPEIWAKIVSPQGAVFSYPGYLDLGGDQTGIDGRITVNGTGLTLGSATTGCEIDVPVHLHGAYSSLTVAKQGSFCRQDLYFWDHGTPGSKFVPAAGSTETVHKCYVDGVALKRGLWGSSASGAPNADDGHFSGTGMVRVVSDDENPTVVVIR